jgi:sugar/nucleoside kinase (ribokinase family)
MDSGQRFDVTVVGAMNYDIVVPLGALDDPARRAAERQVVLEEERDIDDAVAFALFVETVRAGARSVHEDLGGSAFNVMRSLIALDTGLRLAMCGPLGRRPRFIESQQLETHDEHLRSAEANTEGLVRYDGDAGTCVSIVDKGLRGLQTFEDARGGAALRAAAGVVSGIVAASRHVHLTSIFSPDGPAILADVLRQTDALNPQVTVSFDPGLAWIAKWRGNPDFAYLLERSNYLFLNQAEYASLAVPAAPDDGSRAKAVAAATGEATTIVLKDWHSAHLIRAAAGRSPEQDRVRQAVLPPGRIADSTGAGDVLAAGFLAALYSYRSRELGALRFGMDLARQKMQHLGRAGYESLPSAARGDAPVHGGIFVSHAVADSALAQLLVDLLRAAGVPSSRIFCVSVLDNAIPAGAAVVASVRQQLAGAALVLALVTRTYLERPWCRYEIGAAWALGRELIPLAAGDVSPASMDLLLQGTQQLVLRTPSAAENLRARLVSLGLASEKPAPDWERVRDAFIAASGKAYAAD